jgi:hypothetical protein
MEILRKMKMVVVKEKPGWSFEEQRESDEHEERERSMSVEENSR